MMTERKLASVRRISEIKPIENADMLELAIVDGWQCVVRKGQFEADELVCFCEIDSVLPIQEDLEFLRKSCYVKKDWLVSDINPTGEGFRLKSIRLRGQISQGLLLKLDDLFEDNCLEEGADITVFLKIVKWDPPIAANLSGKAIGNFPSFLSKSDQQRVQNLKASDFEPYLGGALEISEKMDGSSITVFRYDLHRNGICSRNLELDMSSEATPIRLTKEYGLLEFLNEYQANLAFQMEIVGPGIQSNPHGLKEPEMFVFDIYDINNSSYVDADERYEWMNILTKWQSTKGYRRLHHVKTMGLYVLDKIPTAEIFLEMADQYPDREGLVFKSLTNPNFSFKAISNQYLLGHDG